MTNKDPRMTGPTLKVLRALLENPSKSLAGSDIRRLTGVGPGTLYPILMRLEEADWLKSEWENIDPSKEGRPRKRFYQLTGCGLRKAQNAFREHTLPSTQGGLTWA